MLYACLVDALLAQNTCILMLMVIHSYRLSALNSGFPIGLNVGCFYAVGTLLNRMIIEHYPVSSALSAVCG